MFFFHMYSDWLQLHIFATKESEDHPSTDEKLIINFNVTLGFFPLSIPSHHMCVANISTPLGKVLLSFQIQNFKS